jgi:uncharacterized DUF497 family protein
MLSFTWDDANITHIARHGVTPEEAEQVIENQPLDLQRQLRNGEERLLHLGETRTGRVLVVVLTVRDERYRVVTAHPADRTMRRFYFLQKDVNDDEDTGDS